MDLMGQAMQEIWRVLKPGGQLYVFEQVCAGGNEILRLFHDVRTSREAASSPFEMPMRIDQLQKS